MLSPLCADLYEYDKYLFHLLWLCYIDYVEKFYEKQIKDLIHSQKVAQPCRTDAWFNINWPGDYNNEHLRNREMDDLYPDDKKWSWDWDLELNRKKFEDKRIRSDQLELFATFGVGALIVNHLVSSIDALYLKRVSSKKTLSIQPHNNLLLGSVGYSLTLSF